MFSFLYLTNKQHRNFSQGMKRAVAILLSILVFSVLYILPTCFTKVPGPGCYDPCLNRIVYKLVKTDLRKNSWYIIFYKWHLTLIISFLVPFGCLLVFNVKIILAFKRNQKRKRESCVKETTTKKGEEKTRNLKNQVKVTLVYRQDLDYVVLASLPTHA